MFSVADSQRRWLRPLEKRLAERQMNSMASRVKHLLGQSAHSPEERERLIRLMCLIAELPDPPDPFALYPCYAELKDRFLGSLEEPDGEALEEAFLLLYAHIHGYEVPYTPDERSRVDETGGYLSHVGGLSPILKAVPFIGPDTVSGDFGAGNGLQGLLIQALAPHAKTVQIEISSRMVEAGRLLQGWLGIPEERVDWVVGDVSDVSPTGMDFIYLYRPLRPTGPGEEFYRSFASQIGASQKPIVIFSIADCLRPYLSSDFEIFYSDGHLTCFRRSDVLGKSGAA
jgi:hypothetical protein